MRQTKRNDTCVQLGAGMEAGLLWSLECGDEDVEPFAAPHTGAEPALSPVVIVVNAASRLFYPESFEELKAVAFIP